MVIVENKEIRATEKQIATVEYIRDNKGASMREAMLHAGYKPSHADNPQLVTRTKGFKELLDVYLPERKLLKKHKEFINAKKVIRTYTKGDITSEIEEIDTSAVKALDMAYKLRGSYATPDVTNNVLVVQLSDASSSRYALTSNEQLTHHDIVDVSSSPPEHAPETL